MNRANFKTLILVTTVCLAPLLATVQAQAFEDVTSCTALKGEMPVSIETLSLAIPGGDLVSIFSAANAQSTTPVAAIAKNLHVGDQVIPEVVLYGQAQLSAKGPYYELSTSPTSLVSLKLFVAAPASKSTSELTLDGKLHQTNCN